MRAICRTRRELIKFVTPLGVPQGLSWNLSYLLFNDNTSAINFFKYIPYIDGTTLLSTIRISAGTKNWISNHLVEVYDWLAVNKWSINVKEIKYIVFHATNKTHTGSDTWIKN